VYGKGKEGGQGGNKRKKREEGGGLVREREKRATGTMVGRGKEEK